MEECGSVRKKLWKCMVVAMNEEGKCAPWIEEGKSMEDAAMNKEVMCGNVCNGKWMEDAVRQWST